jgi:hypothetical protein
MGQAEEEHWDAHRRIGGEDVTIADAVSLRWQRVHYHTQNHIRTPTIHAQVYTQTFNPQYAQRDHTLSDTPQVRAQTRIGLPGPDQTEIAAKVSAKARELGGTTSVRREQISEVASRRVTKDKYLRQALLWWAAGEPDVWPIPATPPSSSSSAASS